MRRILALCVASIALSGCIDFRDRLTCETDQDCLGYSCSNGLCIEADAAPDEEEPLDPKRPQEGGPDGKTATIVSGEKEPVSLSQDVGNLYWLTRESGRLQLKTAVKYGSSSSQLSDLGPYTSNARPALLVTAQGFYVAAGQKVVHIPLAGGAPKVLATHGSNGFGGGIGIAESRLYWLDSSEPAVWSVPISGGNTQKLSATKANGEELVASRRSVYWTTRDGIQMYDALNQRIAGEFLNDSEAVSLAPTGLAANGSIITWLAPAEVFQHSRIKVTQADSSIVDTFSISETFSPEFDLIAAASDGAGHVLAVGPSQASRDSTGLYDADIEKGTFTYLQATGGSGVTGGLASEVIADSRSVYLLVHDLLLRRPR